MAMPRSWYGNAALLEKFLEDATELGGAVGRDSWMTTGKVSRMRSKATHMLRAEGVVTRSEAGGYETKSQTVS